MAQGQENLTWLLVTPRSLRQAEQDSVHQRRRIVGVALGDHQPTRGFIENHVTGTNPSHHDPEESVADEREVECVPPSQMIKVGSKPESEWRGSRQ